MNKKKKRRILSIALALCVAAAMMPTYIFAADAAGTDQGQQTQASEQAVSAADSFGSGQRTGQQSAGAGYRQQCQDTDKGIG